MKIKKVKFYKELLPKKIAVLIHKEKKGLWAEIKGKGLENCYTQAENSSELIKMVNEAVFDYLEIPIAARKDLGFYLPSSLIKALKEEGLRRRGKSILKYINEQAEEREQVAFNLA